MTMDVPIFFVDLKLVQFFHIFMQQSEIFGAFFRK